MRADVVAEMEEGGMEGLRGETGEGSGKNQHSDSDVTTLISAVGVFSFFGARQFSTNITRYTR
jgi:hypothetical protein